MFILTTAIALTLDILSKYFATTYLEKSISLWWERIYLQLAHNSWIAFSIKLPFWLLKIWTIALIIWIYYYYRIERDKEIAQKHASPKLLDISFWLIIGWALGNAYERIFHEEVVDFIGVQYFAIFNLADSFISIGAAILLYHYYIKK
jgi:signal peptidase II